MTNSADPDQLASSEAKWSGFTLFVKAGYIQMYRWATGDNFHEMLEPVFWEKSGKYQFVVCRISPESDKRESTKQNLQQTKFYLFYFSYIFFFFFTFRRK